MLLIWQSSAVKQNDERKNMKILLVEDDEDQRGLTLERLQVLGHSVLTAAVKKTACDIIQQQCREINLFLMDNDLPAPDEGLKIIDFIQDIVNFFRIKKVPTIIVMSGRDKSKEAEMAGAEFLPKPFSLMELKSAIQRAMAKKELTAETYI